jgi:hypothetical protein
MPAHLERVLFLLCTNVLALLDLCAHVRLSS